jgi:hypothetical protein
MGRKDVIEWESRVLSVWRMLPAAAAGSALQRTMKEYLTKYGTEAKLPPKTRVAKELNKIVTK